MIIVRVDADEVLCDGGKLLPYSTWIGTISKRTGKVNVWMPAAYTPRGYKAAARCRLEALAEQVKGGFCSECGPAHVGSDGITCERHAKPVIGGEL